MTNIDLTRSEKEIMEVIWASERPLMIKEILNLVKEKFDKDWKSQTLSSFLRTLVGKGMIDYYRKNMFSFYWGCVTREEYGSMMQRKILKEWFDNSKTEFLSTFVETAEITREELKKIYGWVN